MRWRRLLIATHRDLGYLFAGLTVIYAVSGVAVNHIDDWNPNYVLRTEEHVVGDLPDGNPQLVAGTVMERLAISEDPISVVRLGPDLVKIFFEGRTLTVRVSEGLVQDEHARRRWGFFHLNYLHLNHGKGIWTWIADVYAVGLAVLACSGIFIITGRKGLGGRGRWFLVVGLAIPVLYLVLRL